MHSSYVLEQSFAVINQEIGDHNFSPAEYAIVQRVTQFTLHTSWLLQQSN
ncbi:MAG: hypothetical protein F6J92_37715 [Symploca sp. SIO1A3]|nr:hypothetical protein [Symploca sp. SIO1A3]